MVGELHLNLVERGMTAAHLETDGMEELRCLIDLESVRLKEVRANMR